MTAHLGTGRIEILVMAAGIGARYGSLKQLEPVGPTGELLLDYALYDARRAGVSRAVFVISRALEREFHETIGRRWERRLDIEYAFQDLGVLPAGRQVPAGRTKPWGTAQAVLSARDAIHAPFLVINADDYYGAESYQSLASFLRSGDETAPRYAMVAFALRNTLSEHGSVARGVCETDGEGRLVGVTEYTTIERSPEGIVGRVGDGPPRTFTGDEHISMNIWGFTRALFEPLAEEFERFLGANGESPRAELYLPTVVNALLAQRDASVAVLPTSARWLGMTYRADRPTVSDALLQLHRSGEYPESLWG